MRYHMHIDVRGAIRWPKKQLKGMFRDGSGKLMDADAVIAHLMDQLAAGRELIPCGQCDNFDYGKDGGCIESMLMYHGESVQEITDVFVNVVDDYLAHCAKHAVSPNKPMAGHTERHGK
jgi:hypothetical protein